jgi:hypothetical protein
MLIVNRDGTIGQEIRSVTRAHRLRQVGAVFRHSTSWMKQLIGAMMTWTRALVGFPVQERSTQLYMEARVAYDHPACGC